MGKETIDALVDGGKASAAPPLGPALGAAKVNIGQVISDINEKTSAFKGMQVPIKIVVDTDTKKYTISVGTPPVSSLIKKEMGVKKLAHVSEEKMVLPGDIKLDALIKIAKSKDSLAGDTKSKVTQVLGTCLSGGVTVDGKNAREVIREIKEGEIKVE